MYSVLNCMIRLKHFSCVRWTPCDSEVDPYWIRAGLEYKSKDTLESLELVGYHLKNCPDSTVKFRPWHYMDSLCNFSVLKEVSINTGLSSTRRPESGDEDSPPWFPTSIRSITFHTEHEGARDSATKRILRFLNTEYRDLPHLEEINIKGMGMPWDEKANTTQPWIYCMKRAEFAEFAISSTSHANKPSELEGVV